MAAEGIPVLVLKEGTARTKGKDALMNNIQAAKTLADIMRSSLGPRGMDKMLVDQFGDITITNDGAAILDEIDIVHPGAKFVAKIAKSQDIEVGDGTTTSVVLAGELLREAEELLLNDIHPTVIIDGYLKSLRKALEILDEIAITIDKDNEEEVKKIAKTSISTKILSTAADHFADIAYKAVKQVAIEVNGEVKIPLDNIKIEKREGGSLEDSEFINGIIIDKEVVHHRMPKKVENAKILLIAYPLELEKPETADVNIMMDQTKIDQLLMYEKQKLKEMANKIIKTGANVVFCQKGIDDIVQHYLAKAGILAVRRVKKSDMEKLSRATGAKIIMNESYLDAENVSSFLGEAGVVEEKKVGDESMIFVRDCKDPKAVSVLLRGGTKLMLEEVERAFKDMLNTVRNVLLSPKVVPAGGAPEVELAVRLREYAKEVGGKESMIIEAYANAVEKIPATLIETTGLDVIEVLRKIETYHKNGEVGYGLNALTGEVTDMAKAGIYDPLRVKVNALKSATEAATMILRIDDVIAAKEAFEAKKEESKIGEGGGEED
ncbi:MAG: thermosome subunit beta [Candidatus Njordarchaeia archaeon]